MGGSSVSTAAAAFRKRGWSVMPTGSVSLHRRDADDLDPGLGGKLLERGPEHRRSVAEVGAEPDVGTGHAGPERERSAVGGRPLRRDRARMRLSHPHHRTVDR